MFQLDNRFIHAFQPEASRNGPPRAMREAFAWVDATPVSQPRLLAYSTDIAAQLGLSEAQCQSEEFLQLMAGNSLPADGQNWQPWAYNYGGHQFGHWAGQLGDGRALSLAEVAGAAGGRFELQLKGAGPTPFSRHADGRAVLRSSLREFVCSEAMHALGVPTTRALSLISTGDAVVRDMFYDGRRKAEPGAIVCRVAPSFLRFGHFELPASRGDQELLANLWNFCLQRDFPELSGKRVAEQAFTQICLRTAEMIAQWLRVGFVHGVMNTDNFSILGLTLDYGPYGWMESFDPGWTPNTTDAQGKRYCYARQAEIGFWNLQALASALVSLFPDQAALKSGLQAYTEHFNLRHRQLSADKFGLIDSLPNQSHSDATLVRDWFALMEAATLDFTLSFRALHEPKSAFAALSAAADEEAQFAEHAAEVQNWLARYQQRSEAQDPARRLERMEAANPIYVPRNYLAQLAIDAAEQGDVSFLQQWLEVLKTPYTAQQGAEKFAAKRPLWARERAGCSMLSCSS